ncbi:aldehyde ferredoxin oxidoreductase C-terminal domain-containing protein [Chloroflexota bacterium]
MLNRKIAWIDLTDRTVKTEIIPIEWRRKFLGARGINNFLQWSLTDSKTTVQSPEAPLLVGAGWMTGVPGFGGRTNIGGVSPEPSRMGCGNVGGYFGPEMRYAGFDHLVIRGQSKTPVYLMITDDNIEILDADYLWGLEVRDTQEAVRRHHDDHEIRSLVIGPAGENLVQTANVMTGHKNSAGARYGLGFTMGVKKLKAIAARGTGDIKLAHPKEYLTWLKEQQDIMHTRKWIKAMGKYGTPLLLTVSTTGGWVILPEGRTMSSVSADKLDLHTVGMAACYGCSVHCRHRHHVSEGKYAGTAGEGPEYSGTWGYGLLTFDMEAVMALTDQCNRLGINVGADHSRLVHKLLNAGLITEEDIGFRFELGDADSISRLIDDVAYRRTPLGNILADRADGLKRLPPEAANHMELIKGHVVDQEVMKATKSFAFAHGVATLPSHAHRNRPGVDVLGLPEDLLEKLYGGPVSGDYTKYDGKARMVLFTELLFAICDSLGCCQFQTVFNSPNLPKHAEYQEMIRLTTGLDFSIDELKDISNRIDSIERLSLGQHGYGDRNADALPEAWYEPVTEGPMKGERLDRDKYEEFLDEYYAMHGWDSNGVPSKELIKRLGIAKAKGL